MAKAALEISNICSILWSIVYIIVGLTYMITYVSKPNERTYDKALKGIAMSLAGFIMITICTIILP